MTRGIYNHSPHSEETKQKIGKGNEGKKNGNWNGGEVVLGKGYIGVLLPDHPYVSSKGYYMKHRLAMEIHLGRHLLPTEVVHHINGIKTDNRIENLMLFSNKGEHLKLHGRPKKGDNYGKN